MLLGRFLDMGPWAVDLVVIGIISISFLFLFTICDLFDYGVLFLAGPVRWNISICSEAVANNNSRIKTNSCIYMDKDPCT